MASVTLPGIGEGDTQRTEVSVRQMAQQVQGLAADTAAATAGLVGKVNRTGDTFTGDVDMTAGHSYKIGGTVVIGASGTVMQVGSSGSTRIERKDVSDTQGDVFVSLAKLAVQTGPNWNAITGSIVQDGSNGSSFPTGVTGYAHLNNAGNTAFGMFARVDSSTAGSAIAAEFNTFNNYADANSTFPPNGSFGTTDAVNIPIQVVAYGTHISKAGIYINSGLAGFGFQAGLYLDPLSSNLYGVFVDANTAVSPNTAGQFNTTGGANTNNLALQMKNAANATAKFIKAYDSSGNSVFAVDGAGTTTYNNQTNGRAMTVGVADGFNGNVSVTGGGDINLQVSGGTKVNVSLNTTTVNTDLAIGNSKRLRIISPSTPASATATGTTGDIVWDSGFLYVCVGTNTWKRTALATW